MQSLARLRSRGLFPPPLCTWWQLRWCRGAAAARNDVADKISLHVIGNGAEGNPRSVIIDYSDRLFLFNCGEGLQRTLPEFGFKSTKVERCFVTSNNWHNVSGLSSLLMARFDGGIRDFHIAGLDNIEDIVKECIRFDTKLKRVTFHYLDCADPTGATIQCDDLTIRPVIVELADKSKSVVYLVQVGAQKGQVNLEKCFKLRVPRQLVANLAKGMPVSLENGQTILPSDVCNSDQPEKRFIILESLGVDFLAKLEQSAEIVPFLQRSDGIVHFTNDRLLNTRQYKSFLKNLRSSYHLLITESNSPLCLYSAHRFQTQLNWIDSKLFPMLSEKPTIDQKNYADHLPPGSDKEIRCPSGLSFRIRPHPLEGESTISFDRIPQFDLIDRESALLYQDGSVREGLKETLESLHQQQQKITPASALSYPEFVFLGTASALSLPIRNVPCILVNLSSNESILLECGENTYGQLLRFYGPANIGRVLKSIKAVFISHHHSDHHMGLVQLIERRHHFADNKLMVIMPPMVSKFLHSKSVCFSSLNNLNAKYNYVINRYFDGSKSNVTRLLKSVADVQLIPVSHCVYAYGISVTSKSGFRFVYSGDTQPCDSLVQHGRNCDLLIHEATVEDGLISFARTNFHTTMSEAIDVGLQMKARFTILTHFSQRYGKLPFLAAATSNHQQHNQSVGLAFDNMRISPADLNRLPLMYDALQCMYSKHLENLEYKSELYSRKYGKSSR